MKKFTNTRSPIRLKATRFSKSLPCSEKHCIAQKRAYSYIFIRELVELKIGGDNGLALLFQTFGAHLPFSITNPHMQRILFFSFSFELCPPLKLCIYSGSEPISHIRTAIVMWNGDRFRWVGAMKSQGDHTQGRAARPMASHHSFQSFTGEHEETPQFLFINQI